MIVGFFLLKIMKQDEKRVNSAQPQDKRAYEMLFFCSGVSVNVQDLAPSCAGALFGKF